MSKYVLFSPVGNTDPYRGDFDGPMLHIIRHFRPHKAYIFLTPEMWKKELSDKRYSRSVKKISEILGFECQPDLIASNIADPSNFDAFLSEFKNCIDKISEENKDSQILANVTSGTPQMQLTLCLLAYTERSIIRCIQVKTFAKKSNENTPPLVNYNEEDIENLLDNLPDAENRCIAPGILSYRSAFAAEKIKSLVQNYDYKGAVQLLEMNEGLFTGKASSIAKHLENRSKWNLKDADRYLKAAGLKPEDCYPGKNAKVKNISEFYLGMRIKLARKEYVDFLLGLSPLLTDICRDFIADVLKYPVDDLIDAGDSKTGDIPKITRKKLLSRPELLKWLDSKFSRGFYDMFVSFNLLLKIAEYVTEVRNLMPLGGEIQNIMELLSGFRRVEERLRNPAAHEMIYIDDKLAVKEIGKSLEQISNELEKLILLVYKDNLKHNFSKAYEMMHDLIFREIENPIIKAGF